jgi:hypothetical protein
MVSQEMLLEFYKAKINNGQFPEKVPLVEGLFVKSDL